VALQLILVARRRFRNSVIAIIAGGEFAMQGDYRNRAAFGKRIEFWIIGLMLKDGLDVYVPLVDDHAVDALIKRKDGTIAQVQVKGCSALAGDPAFFGAIYHEARRDYWFVFHSEGLTKTWLMSSQEFLAHARSNKTGKWIGEMSISFACWRKGVAQAKEQFKQFEVADFKKLSVAPQSAETDVSQP
jgi:hypothetical protein